jgi:hypothetical protein
MRRGNSLVHHETASMKAVSIFTSGPFIGQLFNRRFILDEPDIVLLDFFKTIQDEKPTRTAVIAKRDYMKWMERYLT